MYKLSEAISIVAAEVIGLDSLRFHQRVPWLGARGSASRGAVQDDVMQAVSGRAS